MLQSSRSPLLAHVFTCWNWKCALLSASARSIVYAAAMAHSNFHRGLSIVLVEMGYVALTAGLYAGMQQKALGFRSRSLGNLTVVLAVPLLAQTLDWLTHQAAGAPSPGKATLAVCVFGVVSALFHLHVMRRGAFLTGVQGRALIEDFRRMPRLIAGFILEPVRLLSVIASRLARWAESEAAQ